MSNPFQKASRSQVFLKLAVTGVSGSGKTLSALRLAWGMVKETGKRIALIDTENDSASLYADMTTQQCKAFGLPDPIEFDVCGIEPPFAAAEFNNLVQQAASDGYGVVVIDSASHLWKGILSYKGDIDARGGNQYTNWRDPDKKFQDAIDAVLQSKINVIFCMRSKTEYIMEDNGKGKQVPRKVGLAPVMREGLEYEFSAVLDIQMDHKAQSSKDRTGLFPTDRIFQITEETGTEINAWLKTATPKPESVTQVASNIKDAFDKSAGVISDEQAKAGNVAKLRAIIETNKGTLELWDAEKSFCLLMGNKLNDGKPRNELTDFTLEELRGPVWKARSEIIAEIARLANAATPKP